MTTKIYDIGNSVVMGLDVLGTALELKKENPVTIGGAALKRYRSYIKSFVPEDFAPDLHPDLRTKKYFQSEGLEIASINIYAGWVATFFSWLLLPFIQPINLVRVLKARATRKSQLGTETTESLSGGRGAPSYGD